MTPGARPGELLAAGPAGSWLVYVLDGAPLAACYIRGRLLRRDVRGWWVADLRGERQDVADATVAAMVETVPPGWELHPEQTPLALAAELAEKVA